MTLTVDEKVLQWARRAAAAKGLSVSKFVGQLLDQEMRRTDAYWVAYERWKKRKPVIAAGKLPIRREEIYDRGR